MRDEDVVRRHESELERPVQGGGARRHHAAAVHGAGPGAGPVDERCRRTLAAAWPGSSGNGGTAADTNTLPPMDETKPSQITFYNWTDYIDPAIKKDFQKAEGITVKEVYSSSNEEMLAKMRAGAKGYDVIVPSPTTWCTS